MEEKEEEQIQSLGDRGGEQEGRGYFADNDDEFPLLKSWGSRE